MSLTKIQSARRIAIWEAHGRRCIYCNQLILFNDLEIDHIIPERLSKTPKRLVIVTKNYGLQDNFDLNSFDNLLPAHQICNSRKTGLLFKKSTALYFLEIAAAKAKQAAIEEQSIFRRSRRDRVLASLQVALEAGELSRADVTAITNKIETEPDAIETIHELQFSNRIVKGLLSQSDVDKLLDEPILPRKYGLDELKMQRGFNDEAVYCSVRTCREWANAVHDGFIAASGFGIKEEAFFKRVYSVVRALSIARVADRSYISRPFRGIDDLDLLPVTMLPQYGDGSPSEDELSAMEKQGLSIADLVKKHEVVIEQKNRHYLSLVYRGMGKVYWEFLRADLNGDGTEDILLNTYEYATQGTFGYGDVMLITKLADDSKFEILSDSYFHP